VLAHGSLAPWRHLGSPRSALQRGRRPPSARRGAIGLVAAGLRPEPSLDAAVACGFARERRDSQRVGAWRARARPMRSGRRDARRIRELGGTAWRSALSAADDEERRGWRRRRPPRAASAPRRRGSGTTPAWPRGGRPRDAMYQYGV